MTSRYAVQARRRQRRPGAPDRDEVRLADTDTLDDARTHAHRFAADGYTVWIYRVDPGPGAVPRYRAVEQLRPATPH